MSCHGARASLASPQFLAGPVQHVRSSSKQTQWVLPLPGILERCTASHPHSDRSYHKVSHIWRRDDSIGHLVTAILSLVLVQPSQRAALCRHRKVARPPSNEPFDGWSSRRPQTERNLVSRLHAVRSRVAGYALIGDGITKSTLLP